MKQHPAERSRQADQTAAGQGSSHGRATPLLSHITPPPLVPCSPCMNLSSRLTSLFIRSERIKYFTRLQSILQGLSVDISNISLTLLSHSLLVEQGALHKAHYALHRRDARAYSSCPNRKRDGASSPSPPSIPIPFSPSPAPTQRQHCPITLSFFSAQETLMDISSPAPSYPRPLKHFKPSSTASQAVSKVQPKPQHPFSIPVGHNPQQQGTSAAGLGSMGCASTTTVCPSGCTDLSSHGAWPIDHRIVGS